MRRIVSAIWHIVEETMDDTDRRLVALLRENARLPVATLAQLLKVSRGTVQNRIDRLTADGVIGGFTVRLKPEAEPQRVRAITMVAVERRTHGRRAQIAARHPGSSSAAHHQRPLGHCCRTRRGKPRGFRPGAATHPAHQGDFEFRDKSTAGDAQGLT